MAKANIEVDVTFTHQPFVAQIFGQTDEHWLLKVGKTNEAEFDLDENKELNRFYIIYFREVPV